MQKRALKDKELHSIPQKLGRLLKTDALNPRFVLFGTSNLFVTSKNETTNSPTNEFKVLHKGQPLFNGLLFITLKKHFKPCFFILKALKDILQHFEFMNW